MDKASKWFRSILGLKSRDKPTPSSKRRRSSVKSYREKDSSSAVANGNANGGVRDDPADHNDKHAIAAVAEAAVAVDQTASAVFRLTGSSGGCARDPAVHGALEESAAVKIQSTFRGYLARRALRALKGLVKLQALVRGHIERKRTKEWLRKMQALLQAQTNARAGRSRISEHSRLSSKSSHFHHPFNQRNGSKLSGRTLDDYEHIDEQAWIQRVHSTRIGPMDDEKNERRNLFHLKHLASSSDLYSFSFTNSIDTHRSAPTPSLCEGQSFYPLKYSNDVEESSLRTADNEQRFSANTNSLNFYSALTKGGSSKRSPFTPAKSDGSTSYLSSYSDHPNYMSYTESSRAKARSMSAPKLRPQHDGSNSTKRYFIHGSGELKSRTLKSALHANFASKAYPGSGRLDRLGMPVE